AAVFGDALDPGCVGLSGVDLGIAGGTLRPEGSENLGGDQIGGVIAQQLHVALGRTVAVVGSKARVHLLVRQPLQLSSVAAHFVRSPSITQGVGQALACGMVKTGLGPTKFVPLET